MAILLKENKILFLLSSTAFLISLGFGVLIPFLPIYLQVLGISSMDIGIIFSSYTIGLLLARYPAGYLNDMCGGKWVMVGGMSLFSVSLLAMLLAKTTTIFCFLRFVQGTGSGLYSVSAITYLSTFTAYRTRGEVLGSFDMFSRLGVVMGPAVGGFLLALYDFKASIVVGAFFSLLVIPILAKKVENIRPQPQRKEKRELLCTILPKVKKVSPFIVLIFCSMISMVALSSIQLVLPLFLKNEMEIPVYQIGLIMTVGPLCIALTALLYGKLSDAFGRKLFISWGLISYAALFLFLTIVSKIGLVEIFITFVIMSGAGALFPPLVSAVSELVKRESRGKGMALFGMFNGMGNLIGPIIVGFFLEGSNWDSLFVTMALIIVFSLLIEVVLFKEDTTYV
jgi:DHA1 family multidrug resistance protein-like MFS transporter